MFLHVGNNKNILIERVVGIFDMDNATLSAVSRKFLSQSERAGLSTNAALDELPKSFVLYIDSDNKYKICYSQLSTASLKGRLKFEESDARVK